MSEEKKLILLIGQSNMSGRGRVEAEDLHDIPGLLKLNKALVWESATEPVHYERLFCGTGPGRTFGMQLLHDNPGSTVGLVPCAVGGSHIGAWKPGVQFTTGEFCYDDMLKRIAIARKTGIFEAILWHQGEADAVSGNPDYVSSFTNLIYMIRRELQNENIPVIVGGIGAFLTERYAYAKSINQALCDCAKEIPHCAFVDTSDLADRGDKLHFNSAGVREMGRRYYLAYKSLLQLGIGR